MSSRAGTGCRQLPLVAVCQRAHQKLPVSLVRIRPNGVVDTASHEGNINHYQYRRPALPAAADARLRALYGAPTPTAAASSSPAVTSAAGFSCGEGGSSCTHWPSETPATVEGDRAEVGTETIETCVGVQQHGVAPHESPQGVARTAALPFIFTEGPGAAADALEHATIDRPQPEQQGIQAACEPDKAGAPEPGQALSLVSVERIAGLSVLDTDALLPGPGGRPERILTGFQVQFQWPFWKL